MEQNLRKLQTESRKRESQVRHLISLNTKLHERNEQIKNSIKEFDTKPYIEEAKRLSKQLNDEKQLNIELQDEIKPLKKKVFFTKNINNLDTRISN